MKRFCEATRLPQSVERGSVRTNFSAWHRKSRQKKQRLFLELMRPSRETRILNVGATGTGLGFDHQFESCYQYRDQVTGGGTSLEEIGDYKRAFPEVNALVFDGCALPFADKSFDIVYSNAVIEHLEDWNAQQAFAHEIQRVGRAWFVTTPNLWFPIEPHYHLPLVQFLPQEWQKRLVRSLGRRPYPALHLLGRRRLQQLFPAGTVVRCRVTFYPETLIVYKGPQ